MSRRKRKSAGRRAAPAPTRPDPQGGPEEPRPLPDPPRPNKPFLVLASILLAVWVLFLVVLAVVT
jgi:hypothetical protein